MQLTSAFTVLSDKARRLTFSGSLANLKHTRYSACRKVFWNKSMISFAEQMFSCRMSACWSAGQPTRERGSNSPAALLKKSYKYIHYVWLSIYNSRLNSLYVSTHSGFKRRQILLKFDVSRCFNHENCVKGRVKSQPFDHMIASINPEPLEETS